MQQLKRMGVGSGSEEDPTHSGKYALNYIQSWEFFYSYFQRNKKIILYWNDHMIIPSSLSMLNLVIFVKLFLWLNKN